MSDYISQTITVSSCQSDISNQCRIKTAAAGGGGWHKASVSDCLPLAAPTGLSPLHILTLCGPERVLVGGREVGKKIRGMKSKRGAEGVGSKLCGRVHTPTYPYWHPLAQGVRLGGRGGSSNCRGSAHKGRRIHPSSGPSTGGRYST